MSKEVKAFTGIEPGLSASPARLRCKIFGGIVLSLLAMASPIATTAAESINLSVSDSNTPVCLYISSYHKGYAWSDGLEKGLRKTLEGHCSVVQFDMNTKRKKKLEDKELAGGEALKLAKEISPDIIITSDDNAAKYFIVPYYKNQKTPVVFSGINWTVEEYGFPFSNVTGVVEVAPIEPMLEQIQKMAQGGDHAVYLGANTLTERKNFKRIESSAQRLGISLDGVFANTLVEWQLALAKAQQSDFVVLGSNSGIEEWDPEIAADWAVDISRVPSVTSHKWMMPYSLLGFTKIPSEQGELAGERAIAILEGTSPGEIPIVTNRKWDTWIHPAIVNNMNVEMDDWVARKAKRVVSQVD